MTNPDFSFTIQARDGKARTGVIAMPRGEIRTPAFMPVGTAGTVKGLTMEQVRQAGADIVLGNTYHLMLRPGAERVHRLGGLHAMMRWDYPILTDSGGFQVMSLASLRTLTEEGVTFQSHIDGSRHVLTPERSIEIQHLLDSNILMQLDECIRLPAPEAEVARAMRLSYRWAERSKAAFERLVKPGEGRALFGIVQGGTNPDLRRESAEALAALDLPGYAIGGLAVGEPQAEMLATIAATEPFLPAGKPRYLMGVGTPDDLVESVARGVDMFDCVMPTRAGRHGTAYTRFGKLNLRNTRFAEDSRPLDAASACPATRDYSRAYLHHLTKSDEMLGQILLSWNNIAYYEWLMAEARAAIRAGAYADFLAATKEGWARGEV
ncbi:tRNA guanosine(34) transglycosylase Tgt [Rhabdaerophilum calidifontis]|uniref:tRNA guanosine(34) transglycosylase Tgt n=1 Tax=Rhabdaerophilum calidifontis TaxID=2604328 RepID=UPI0012383FEB|nr:tRNA guanosine(34) transglycosylase Tgt [Rhabdaerophilum calidifontis]